MEKSWLDSILAAGTTDYGALQARNTKPVAPAPAPSALPAWALPAGIGVLALLLVGFILTRSR